MAIVVKIEKSQPDAVGRVTLTASVRETDTGAVPPSERTVRFTRNDHVFAEVPLVNGEASSELVDDRFSFYARSMPSGRRSRTLPKERRPNRPQPEAPPEEHRDTPEAGDRDNDPEQKTAHDLPVPLSICLTRCHWKGKRAIYLKAKLLNSNGVSIAAEREILISYPGSSRSSVIQKTDEISGELTWLISRNKKEREVRVEVELPGTDVWDSITIRFVKPRLIRL